MVEFVPRLYAMPFCPGPSNANKYILLASMGLECIICHNAHIIVSFLEISFFFIGLVFCSSQRLILWLPDQYEFFFFNTNNFLIKIKR